MQKLIMSLTAVSMALAPASALAAPNDPADFKPGVFVGARMKLSFGGRAKNEAHAGFAIAPTSSRISDGHVVRTRIGEGLSLDFGAKPTLNIAGQRADYLLGIKATGQAEGDKKLGVSTGGWIAIGFGAAAIVGGLVVLHILEEADANSD